MKNILRHVSAFIAPVVVGIVIPYLVLAQEHKSASYPILSPSTILWVVGLAVGLGGLALFFATVRTFLLIGSGTIMPWDPTRRLVVAGVYRYVRNPMILSVIVVLVGEALAFASPGIASLAVFFFALNTVYFIFSEEPGLVKRFGAEYIEYKKNVPMWLPRLKPWQPGGMKNQSG